MEREVYCFYDKIIKNIGGIGMNTNENVKDLVLKGLLIALVTVSTMLIQIPVPMTSGYIHFGDSMIFLVAIFFGKKNGALAGGIGSMLADIFLSYTHWAPFTLIIKGLMGYAIGSFSTYENNRDNFLSFNTLISVIIGSVIMVGGYFVGGAILKGSFLISLESVPSNCTQVFMGGILFFVVGKALDKVKIYKYFLGKAQ